MVTYVPSHESRDEIAADYFKQDWVYAVVSEVSEYPSQKVTVGFASISFKMKIRGGVIGHIEDVVVDATHRGRGEGRMLVEALLEESRRRNAYRVYLESSESNVSFYKSCGLERSGVGAHGDLLHGDRPA